MQPDDDLPAATTDRRFDALVAGLGHDDPRFVRRVSPPAPRRIGATELSVVVGLVATVVLGIVPLVLGLQLDATALLALGGAGCLVLPVLTPLVVRRALRRTRPLWR